MMDEPMLSPKVPQLPKRSVVNGLFPHSWSPEGKSELTYMTALPDIC